MAIYNKREWHVRRDRPRHPSMPRLTLPVTERTARFAKMIGEREEGKKI